MTSAPICSRRLFLIRSGTTLGATVACSVGCSSAGTGPEAFGTVSAGNVADVAVGTLAPIKGAPALLGRDEKGLYAMTSTCTHAGCDMNSQGFADSTGVSCSCHGSEFDANGAVLLGPATEPLVHFAVAVNAMGNITVAGGTEVAASTRTAVA